MGSMPSATHSPWNRPVVRRPLMPLHGLDAVADGVAEVQRFAHTLLGLVLLHDALF